MLKNLVLWFIFFFVFSVSANALFEISEVFPNTTDDKNLEYITLKNNYTETRSLSWYVLEDTAGKQYLFWSEDILVSGERKQFSRSLTKIILNNSDESVFLYDNEWILVDSIYYENSVKWEFLSFEDIKEDDIIQKIFSWEVYFSDEISPEENNSWGWPSDYQDWKINDFISSWALDVPEINISFQQASYVKQSGSSDIYNCDTSKDICKVNFSLLESFSSDFPEWEYSCVIDFWILWFTWEEQKCNPNTLIFPVWISEVFFKIYSKSKPEIYSEKRIEIWNIKNWWNDQSTTWDLRSEEWETSYNTENAWFLETLKIPEIFFELQRPSYIFWEFWSDEFHCDTSKETCKVNFNLEASFWDWIKSTDYYCEINFWIWKETWEEQKCNPNSVDFPVWNFEVSFKIIHKNFPDIFTEKRIIIENKWYVPSNTSKITSWWTSVAWKTIKSYFVAIKDIIVQSGVLKNWFNNFSCKKEACSMNLNYQAQEKDDRCLWDFWQWIASSATTYTRCNPGIIKYGLWEFNGSLTVYEKWNDTNFKKINFTVTNIPDIFSKDEELLSQDLEKEVVSSSITSSIVLQWKLSHEKTLTENKLSCLWVKKCNINLTAEIDWNKKGLSYIWTINGETFSEKQNPSGMWIETWEYEIILEILRGEDIIETQDFYVEVSNNVVLQSAQKNDVEWVLFSEKSNRFLLRDMTWVSVGKILPNPAWKDTLEFIEIVNNSWESKNMQGCVLQDSSKKYILWNDILAPWETKYYFSFETKLTLWNSKDSVTLSCGDVELFSINYQRKIWDNELLSGEVFQWFSLFELLNLIPQNEHEKILKKYMKLKFLVLKRDWFKISWSTFPNARIEIISEGKVVLTLNSDKNWKILLKTKNIWEWNYDYALKIYSWNSEYILSDVWNFKILAAQRSGWFAKKKKKSTTKSSRIPTLKISQAEAYETWSEDKNIMLTLTQKIVLFAWLFTLFLLLAFHMITILIPKSFQNSIVDIFLTTFATREKILLILN